MNGVMKVVAELNRAVTRGEVNSVAMKGVAGMSLVAIRAETMASKDAKKEIDSIVYFQ
jgi:hypothetical protein